VFRGVCTRSDGPCLVPFRWLDTTPTSRVITRVTQDIRAGMFCLFLSVRGLNVTALFFCPIYLGFVWLNVSIPIKSMAVVYLTPVFVFPCVYENTDCDQV
jgi:hypothetical protein